MSRWPTVPVAPMEPGPPVSADGPPNGVTAERSGRRVAMAPPVDGAPPADDASGPRGAGRGAYATLADHPASDETMATAAEPPSDPDGGPADKGDAS